MQMFRVTRILLHNLKFDRHINKHTDPKPDIKLYPLHKINSIGHNFNAYVISKKSMSSLGQTPAQLPPLIDHDHKWLVGAMASFAVGAMSYKIIMDKLHVAGNSNSEDANLAKSYTSQVQTMPEKNKTTESEKPEILEEGDFDFFISQLHNCSDAIAVDELLFRKNNNIYIHNLNELQSVTKVIKKFEISGKEDYFKKYFNSSVIKYVSSYEQAVDFFDQMSFKDIRYFLEIIINTGSISKHDKQKMYIYLLQKCSTTVDIQTLFRNEEHDKFIYSFEHLKEAIKITSDLHVSTYDMSNMFMISITKYLTKYEQLIQLLEIKACQESSFIFSLPLPTFIADIADYEQLIELLKIKVCEQAVLSSSLKLENIIKNIEQLKHLIKIYDPVKIFTAISQRQLTKLFADSSKDMLININEILATQTDDKKYRVLDLVCKKIFRKDLRSQFNTVDKIQALINITANMNNKEAHYFKLTICDRLGRDYIEKLLADCSPLRRNLALSKLRLSENQLSACNQLHMPMNIYLAFTIDDLCIALEISREEISSISSDDFGFAFSLSVCFYDDIMSWGDKTEDNITTCRKSNALCEAGIDHGAYQHNNTLCIKVMGDNLNRFVLNSKNLKERDSSMTRSKKNGIIPNSLTSILNMRPVR